MSLLKTVSQKLKTGPNKLSEFLEDTKLSEEEKEAIDQAERLADEYSDIKPDQLVISSNYLFCRKD